MSREKLKIISEPRMRERGYPVYVVTCPRCYCKLEKLRYDDAPTNCPSCLTPCIPFVQWNAERLMAEIDLMPVAIFRRFLQTVGKELINRNQIESAKVLAVSVIGLNAVLEGSKTDAKELGWTVDEMQEAFNC